MNHVYTEGQGTFQHEGLKWAKCSCFWSGSVCDNPRGDWERHVAEADQREAQQRLWDATPDLLTVAKEVAEAMRTGALYNPSHIAERRAAKLEKRLRAAITKAEGVPS